MQKPCAASTVLQTDIRLTEAVMKVRHTGEGPADPCLIALKPCILPVNGKINYFDDPLVKNIGQFIYKAYINDPWYINFADASAQIQPDAYLIFSYGQRINDPVLSAFGAQLNSMQNVHRISGRIQSPGRSLPQLFGLQKINAAIKSWPYLRDAWLPDLQVMAARSVSGWPSGLFLAAKGGHNAESHNHNDVGNFIVYYNGQPVIIDAGVGAYTAKTFSAERYTDLVHAVAIPQPAYH